jgi:hypothetical protein
MSLQEISNLVRCGPAGSVAVGVAPVTRRRRARMEDPHSVQEASSSLRCLRTQWRAGWSRPVTDTEFLTRVAQMNG